MSMADRWVDEANTKAWLASLPEPPDEILAALDRTWAGCMTPADDVIAHLLMVRADEPGYWAKCNQHDPSSPEAGL